MYKVFEEMLYLAHTSIAWVCVVYDVYDVCGCGRGRRSRWRDAGAGRHAGAAWRLARLRGRAAAPRRAHAAARARAPPAHRAQGMPHHTNPTYLLATLNRCNLYLYHTALYIQWSLQVLLIIIIEI